MSWNDGYERKKLEGELKKEEEILRGHGISDDDIKALRNMAYEDLNSRRWNAEHTQSFEEEFDDGDYDESQNPLYLKFADKLTTHIDEDEDSESGWIDKISCPGLVRWVKSLTVQELELLTLIIIKGFSKKDAAIQVGMKQRTMERRFDKWRRLNVFKNIF